MSSRKAKTPVIIVDPNHSLSTSRYDPSSFLTPPPLPPSSAAQYPRKSQTQYSYSTRAIPNDPRPYDPADEGPTQYDAYPQGYNYRMSESSRSGSEYSRSHAPSQPQRQLVRMPYSTGGRDGGGPPANEHGYEAISRHNNVVHNYGAGSLDPDRTPTETRLEGVVPYRTYTSRRQGGY